MAEAWLSLDWVNLLRAPREGGRWNPWMVHEMHWLLETSWRAGCLSCAGLLPASSSALCGFGCPRWLVRYQDWTLNPRPGARKKGFRLPLPGGSVSVPRYPEAGAEAGGDWGWRPLSDVLCLRLSGDRCLFQRNRLGNVIREFKIQTQNLRI